MSKNLIIGVLVVALIGVGVVTFWPSLSQAPAPEGQTATTTEDENTAICAQVITPARNPDTGEIREFPTPCDVPEGWETIENDIPDLNIELQ